MKGLICVLVVFALLSLGGMPPFENHDASELLPVQVLVAEFSEQGVTLTGDEGQYGSGRSWAEAVEDLKNTASGVAFLQTAEKVILTGDWQPALQTVIASGDLRPAAELFQGDVGADAAQLYAYLKTRVSKVTVAGLRAAMKVGQLLKLPELRVVGERIRLQDEG